MSQAIQPTVLLDHHPKQLKLPTMLRDYVSMAATCMKERGDYSTYLLRLSERELIDRERRGAKRRGKAAKFPVIKTFDTFDFTAQPSINETLGRELISGDYMDRHENVLLVGNSGIGKTHLASAMAFIVFSQGRRVRFLTVIAMITQLIEARKQRQLQRMLHLLERYDLLVLDELGYVPCSKAGAELLFEVISQAYERTSLIVTTNLPFVRTGPRCAAVSV